MIAHETKHRKISYHEGLPSWASINHMKPKLMQRNLTMFLKNVECLIFTLSLLICGYKRGSFSQPVLICEKCYGIGCNHIISTNITLCKTRNCVSSCFHFLLDFKSDTDLVMHWVKVSDQIIVLSRASFIDQLYLASVRRQQK